MEARAQYIKSVHITPCNVTPNATQFYSHFAVDFERLTATCIFVEIVDGAFSNA